MYKGDGELREARADVQMTVSSRPPFPPDNEAPAFEPSVTPAPKGRFPLPPRSRWRLSLIAAVACFVILVTLLLLFTGAGRTTAGTTPPKMRPTATITPSPTATIIPSPTAMVGFKVYTDLPDSFVLQYPMSWVYHPIEPNLGVEFDDSGDNNSNYTMQILVPGDATTPGPGVSPDDAVAWVQYEMDQLAKIPGTLQRETGPIPARQIGGQVWQSGIARISQGTTVIRVQVYATVQNGKPYIINVLAVDDHFAGASQQYFEPMLGSFQFLPPTP